MVRGFDFGSPGKAHVCYTVSNVKPPDCGILTIKLPQRSIAHRLGSLRVEGACLFPVQDNLLCRGSDRTDKFLNGHSGRDWSDLVPEKGNGRDWRRRSNHPGNSQAKGPLGKQRSGKSEPFCVGPSLLWPSQMAPLTEGVTSSCLSRQAGKSLRYSGQRGCGRNNEVSSWRHRLRGPVCLTAKLWAN